MCVVTAGASVTASQALAANIMIAASVAATAYGAYSTHQAGKTSAKVAKNNAIVAAREAEDAAHRGQKEEMEHRLRVSGFKSRQRAQFAASGVDPNSGSASNVLADTAMMGELDALTIRSNAQRASYYSETESLNQLAQADISRTRGRNDAFGTVLSGGSKVAGQWYQFGGG